MRSATKKKPTRPRSDQSVETGTTGETEPCSLSERTGPAQTPLGSRFPVVGIGASAGGLAALEAFFSAMPAKTESGIAFVLVQHLAPDRKSILSELIRRRTHMQVYEVEDGMAVQPNCAYIIPPNRDMAILNGALHLLEPTAPRGMRLPIDFFFRSLAQDQRERAICIVLSGTGSDGTLGVRAVKGEGGMVMVQEPESTEYDGMPRSAIATGLVDYVLRPADMPSRLIGFARHSFGDWSAPTPGSVPRADDMLKNVCVLLRAETGHDFSQYKGNTLARRVERRMAIHQIKRPQQYLQFLQKDTAEVEGLFRDLLIGVTSFFRDSDAFTALEEQITSRLIASKTAGEELRIWVAGCSTGEEAYSIAILIQENLEKLKQRCRVQIFATDIDRLAIAQARSGVFPGSIAADISSDRLARFFIQDAEGETYRARKSIRDLLVFSEQDIVRDPPFSKLDLISCRNLLIYLSADLQKKLITLFHYALRPGGVLFLGSSETVGEMISLFAAIDQRWKIYRRETDLAGASRLAWGSLRFPLSLEEPQSQPARGAAQGRKPDLGDLRTLTEQTLLQHYAKVGVLINGRGEILYIHGRTGNYLEPAPGDATMNMLIMARKGLQRELTAALRRVVTTKDPVRRPGLKVRTNGASITVDLIIKPVVKCGDGTAVADLFLVIIEEAGSCDADQPEQTTDEGRPSPLDVDGRAAELERELQAKEECLQATLEELETSNEELRSSNEEMQSVNEELQSTNEELETSKEELQSVNEELATVNAELQTKVSDLSCANNDMENLLAGTGVGTLFVDHQLRIARFTPAATQMINLIETDVGRPVGHIVSNLVGYDRLVEDVQSVLDMLAPVETEVQTKAGAWQLMRIRPYRTLENVIEGAVITFVDITKQKQTEEALREALTFAESIVATVRGPLLVLDRSLKVLKANDAFCRTFAVSREVTEGRLIYELGNQQWDIPELRALLEKILPEHSSFDEYEVTHDFETIGRRSMVLNARRLRRDQSKEELILLAIEDVTRCE